MAKLILAIEINEWGGGPMTKKDLEKHMKDNQHEWFPIAGEPKTVSVDEAYLRRDPTDDSFFAFELIEVRE